MYRLIMMAAVVVSSATASQIGTFAAVGFEGVQATQNGTVSASIPTSSTTIDSYGAFVLGAAAHGGFLGGGTSAIFSTAVTAPSTTDGSALAYAESLDELTAGGWLPGSHGKLLLDFTVSGSNAAVVTGDPAQGNSTGSSAFGSYSQLSACRLTIFETLQPYCTGTTIRFDLVSYISLPVELSVDIVSGQSFGLELFMLSQTGGHFDHGLVVNFSGSSDFSDTFTLTSVTLLDADGQPVSNPTLTSDSGTVYPLNGNGGPSTSTPEPGGMTMLATGLAALAWRSKLARWNL